MSKNLTRKGLALGAVVALGTSLFAGAPAQAASGINLTDLNNKGLYGMIEAEAFTFLASGNSDFPSGNASQLRVKVKNVLGSANAPTELIGGNAASAENLATTGTTATALGTAAGDTAVFRVSSMTSPFQFSLTSGEIAADTTEKYEVTVFADANNNGIIDSGEVASSTQTVTFYDVAGLTTSIVIGDTTQGSTTVSADVTIAGVDVAQLTAAEWGVGFSSGTGTDLKASAADVDAVTLDADRTKFQAELSVTGLTADTAVKAQVGYLNSAIDVSDGEYNADGTFDSNAKVGSYVTKAVVAASVKSIKTEVVKSTTLNSSAKFKLDSEFKLKVTAKDNVDWDATTAKAVAGSVIKVAITETAGLDADEILTINGTSYTDSNKLPGTGTYAKLSVTTDASGVAYITVKTSGFANGNTVVATASAENGTVLGDSGAANQGALTVTAETTAYKAWIVNHDTTSTQTTDGVAAVVNFEVYDQFGGLPTDGAYEAYADWVSSNQGATSTKNSTAASSTKTAVTSGKATLSILDNGTGTGANVYDLGVKKKEGNGYTGSSVLESTEVDGSSDFTVNIVESVAAGALTVTSYTKNTTTKVYELTAGATSYTLSSGLTDKGALKDISVLGTAPSGATYVTVAGTVTTLGTATASAVQLVGKSVTFTAPGAQFRYVASGSKNVYATDTITVPSGSAGAWSIDIASTKAGKVNLVVTSGTATETVVLDSFAVAAEDKATAIAITAPKTIKPGKTLIVSAVVTDKWGNAVDTNQGTSDARSTAALTFDVTYDGPGYVIGDLPTKTDANGKISFRVLLGAGDTGVAKVSVSYDVDGTATTNAAVTAESATLIGVTASVSAGSKKANVVVKGAEGLTVKVVSGTKVTTKTATSDSYKLSLTKLTKGSKTVKVYVNDILVTSKKVTVRR